MKQRLLIDRGAAVLAERLATRLRDIMIVKICTAFRDRPVTQQGMADLLGLSPPYVSRLLRRAKEHPDAPEAR